MHRGTRVGMRGPESSVHGGEIADRPPPILKRIIIHRPLRWLWRGLALLAVVLALAVLNNNYSLRHQSRAAFDTQLDGALDQATKWISDNRAISERNPTIMYMVADMESMSHEPRLKALLDDYQKNFLIHPKVLFDLVWFRLVNPKAEVLIVHVPDLRDQVIDYVWFGHALAPDKILLSDTDCTNMFSPTKYSWGRRQKQLLAVAMYRNFNGSSPELDNTINYLAEKVARDAHYDFRVSDSYIQRAAFILAARRPDLVRPRWLGRILDYQNPDGSWNYCWHGWCRGILEFGVYNPGHATVQAAWALTMIKYRYPRWVEEHYR